LIVDKNKLGNVVVDYFDGDFHLKSQIVAEAAYFNGGRWEATNGVARTYDGGLKSEEYFKNKDIPITFKPSDFAINRTRPEQMTSTMMLDMINKLKFVGAPSEKEQIQFYSRWASICSHVVVILIGIPFALSLGGNHSKVLSFTFALIFAFVYWGVQAVGQSLGENKFVSPMLAAWMANIIFAIFGLFMMRKVQR
jgi:lipopolysaccharide export system permease protein